MRTDCKTFVLQCVLCARSKPSRHRPTTSLQPLPDSGGPWHSISVGFIERSPVCNGLPLCWWLLTACPRKVFSFQLRTLLLPRTLQVHSFPICPQSVTFLSISPPTADWNSPLTRLPPSNAPILHLRPPPLSNGQAERVNCTWNSTFVFICNYEQDNWSTLFLLAEFTPHATTGAFPFFTTRGHNPLTSPLTQALGTEPWQDNQPDPYGRTADVSRL